MSKRDVLDEQMAQRFRWRVVDPADVLEPRDEERRKAAEAAAALPPEQVSTAERERRERAVRGCADLARQVERVWAMAPATQSAAMATLIRRVEALGLDVVGMQAHPRETVRLWRLVARHSGKLRPGDRRSCAHALSFAPPSPREREVVDLLVEIAQAGRQDLVFSLELCGELEGLGRRHADLGARLAAVLDRGKTWPAREIAARWLSFADLRDAIPSLRRALRLPHARIRWIALEVLLEAAPSSVTGEDVLWLLEDAVHHPLARPWGMRAYETADGYADVLVTAVAKVAPPEGWRPLEIVADGGGALIQRERGGLDKGWALRALAAGYPDRAVARIDRELFGMQSWRRYDAVEAAARLPDDLARPRLIEAAAGPGHRAAERAKALWFERFGGACPVEPLAGVSVELLSAPPSERFLSCLTVLRGASVEAQATLLEALLAEAPADAGASGERAPSAAQREALALLLFSLRDLGEAHRRPGMPRLEAGWIELLFARFGEPALEGVAALVARGARAGVDHGWLGALAEVARKGVLPAAWMDRLRELAAEALAAPAWDGAMAPLVALKVAGAPPELLDRLWSIAMTPARRGEGSWQLAYAVQWAVDALAGMQGAPALDERIAAHAEDALRGRAFDALERVAVLGCRRGTPAALDVAERCVALADEDPGALEVARRCGYALQDAGRIDEAWLLDALGRPASRRFEIATFLCRKSRSPEVLAALERALASDARGGAAAAEAGAALLGMRSLGTDDPRFDGILDRAPVRARAALAGALLLAEGALAPIRRHVMDLLVSADADAAENVFEDLRLKEPEGTYELLETALAVGPNAAVREAIEHYVGEPSEAELYWRDAGEEEEEDEEGE